MSHRRSKAKIERIMNAAYEAAFMIVEAEVRTFLRADPRFIEYVHAVGWGPAFHLADGRCIQYAHDMPTERGRALMEWLQEFYDAYGAGNERLKAASGRKRALS